MVCERLGAESRGLLVQRDTYFYVPNNGRLKLREEAGAAPHLISYARPDRPDQRESSYRIVAVEEAKELKAVLSDTLGIEVVVAKERQLFLWQGVRIHLDEVEALGSFVEFEAVVGPDSDLSHERRQVQALREAFAIDDRNLIEGSYCDLALAGHP